MQSQGLLGYLLTRFGVCGVHVFDAEVVLVETLCRVVCVLASRDCLHCDDGRWREAEPLRQQLLVGRLQSV